MVLDCFPSLKIMGGPIDDDTLTGTCNFFKSSEGYMEAYPQAVYQLSITLRDKWPPSKIFHQNISKHLK